MAQVKQLVRRVCIFTSVYAKLRSFCIDLYRPNVAASIRVLHVTNSNHLLAVTYNRSILTVLSLRENIRR